MIPAYFARAIRGFKKVLRLTLISLLLVLASCNQKSATESVTDAEKRVLELNTNQLRSRIKDAVKICAVKKFNVNFAILCDMSIRSGKNRLFLVDLKKDSILLSGLVANGHCLEGYHKSEVKFSNEIGSNCTSYGRYKIGGKYKGAFGTAYKLKGLDSSNSNAFNRFIVLHGHSCVPNQERLVRICRSEGCPTVAPAFLQKLEPFLDNSKKPMLLWIYNNEFD